MDRALIIVDVSLRPQWIHEDIITWMRINRHEYGEETRCKSRIDVKMVLSILENKPDELEFLDDTIRFNIEIYTFL